MFGVRSSLQKSNSRLDPRKVEGLFKQYSKNGEIIEVEGTERLCTDLGFSTLDPVALVLCYHCGAKQMGIFSRQEFHNGMLSLQADDIQVLRSKIDDMRLQLNPAHSLAKKIYCNVFLLSLDEGQKQLGKEMACELWKILLPLYGNVTLAEHWITYVYIQKTKQSVTKDVWSMVYDLIQTCNSDMSDYDDDGAWPVMIDEFAAYMRECKGANQQEI